MAQWLIKNVDVAAAERLSRRLCLSPLLSRMLVRRGRIEPEEAAKFIKPRLRDLPNPFLLPDLELAVNRLIQALDQKELITIYGDYDSDGLTATALLHDFLGSLGARVNTYVPHRTEEGYGLNPQAVVRLSEAGTQLLVTVDCGVSDLAGIQKARELGLEVIVTDHHQLPDRLPQALALVNPFRGDFPQRRLAGVGVAFFLAGGLRQTLRERGLLTQYNQPELAPYLSLVAIGTVADVMPLTNVNRILVSQGLLCLADPSWPGLAALKEVAAVEPGRPVTAREVAFRLAPRLNASGRLGSAQTSLDLLLTRDPDQARLYARDLEELNTRRRSLQEEMVRQALEMLEEDLSRQKSIVLAREGWNRGIVGLAASRLCEKYQRPAILFALEDELAMGSGRSIKGFNLFAALSECRDLMLRFGGHEQAAGLTVEADKWLDLARAFEAVAQREIEAVGEERPLEIEEVVTLHELNPGLAQDLDLLAPFGEGNPEPVFGLTGLTSIWASAVGSDGRHLKLRLSQDGQIMDAIGFGLGHLLPELGRKVSAAVKRHTSKYEGRLVHGWQIVDIRKETG